MEAIVRVDPVIPSEAEESTEMSRLTLDMTCLTSPLGWSRHIENCVVSPR